METQYGPEELRIIALESAIEAKTDYHDAEDIVGIADTFLAFLKGEKPDLSGEAHEPVEHPASSDPEESQIPSGIPTQEPVFLKPETPPTTDELKAAGLPADAFGAVSDQPQEADHVTHIGDDGAITISGNVAA